MSNNVFGFTIIRGENMPAENKLFLNVYTTGSIRALIYKTDLQSGPNPQWNTKAFFIHPARGLNLHFELISYSKHHNEDNIAAIGDFDPQIHSLTERNQNRNITSAIPITMTVFKKNQPYPDQFSILFIQVHYMPFGNFRSQMISGLQSNPTISSPFYVTLDPTDPIRPVSPYQDNYRLPYELSAILLNEKQQIYEVVNSGNPFYSGCNHSGGKICGTLTSLTQTIRFDPVLLAKASIQYILITVTSNNFVPLKQIFQKGDQHKVNALAIAWSSSETAGQDVTSKQIQYNLTSLPQQELKECGYFPLSCQDDSTLAVVAVGRVSVAQVQKKGHSHSKAQKQATVSLQSEQLQFPSSSAQISPQDPTSIVPIITKMCQYSSDNSSLSVDYSESAQSPKNRAHFPLLVPRSLNEALLIVDNPIISALCPLLTPFTSNHYFYASALDYQFKPLFNCSKKSKNPVEKYIKNFDVNLSLNGNLVDQLSSGELNNMKNSVSYNDRKGIQVSLNEIPNDVFFLMFAVFGSKALAVERPSAKQGKGKKGEDQNDALLETNMTAYSNNDVILFEAPFKFSRTKNSFIWFGLYRDAFGGWGVLNIRKGVFAPDENVLRATFADTMKKILNV